MDSDRTIIGPMNAVYVLVDGKGIRAQIDREMIAGREVGCDVLLNEGRCSRKHASLRPGPEGLTVKDLGSSNGTFINGNRITEAVAKPGDELSFDTAKYKVEGNTAAPLPMMHTDATMMATPAMLAPKAPETPKVEAQPKVAEPSAPKEKPVEAAKPAEKAPKAEKPVVDEPAESQKGAWWAPKDEGPEGTMLLSPGAMAAPAMVEGTQVMAALISAEPSLVGLTGSVKGQSFKLQGDRWKIGRDSNECDIALDDSGVSAFHAQIINEGATWKLINLMSSNGSFVNGQKVQTAYLNSGDRLRFGATELMFNLGGLSAGALNGGSGAAETVTVSKQGTPAWVYAVGGFIVVAAVGAALLFL